MSALTLFSVTDPQTPVWHSTDAKAIQDQLNAKGVRFERWQADRDLGANPSPETVIAAYQHAIDKLVAEKAIRAGTSSACAPITRKKRRCGKNS
ncbi:1,2-dihydroxy-3-keto-5-methylthiopentene dioxygenase [Klebsiella pneumoniae]|nr:1,2-dihydroxy-3-keto-5-methylthiopentene dioxygenase [Klebsiella pneumoniae]